MFCGCKAIGCSFDMPEENAYVENKRAIQEALENKFKEYLDQFTKEDSIDEEENDEEIIQ